MRHSEGSECRAIAIAASRALSVGVLLQTNLDITHMLRPFR